jgi:hypothetical protein
MQKTFKVALATAATALTLLGTSSPSQAFQQPPRAAHHVMNGIKSIGVYPVFPPMASLSPSRYFGKIHVFPEVSGLSCSVYLDGHRVAVVGLNSHGYGTAAISNGAFRARYYAGQDGTNITVRCQNKKYAGISDPQFVAFTN